MNYDQLFKWYTTNVEPWDGGTDNWNGRFNNWAGGIQQSLGTGTEYENLPADLLTNPKYQNIVNKVPQGANQAGLTASKIFGGPNDPVGSAVNTALKKGASGATVNPNTQQVQGSSQAGAFQTSGQTGTTGTQQQTGTTNQTQNTTGTQTGTMNQSTTGTQQQATTGITAQQGTTTSAGVSQPIDTLGLGGLISANKGGAQQAADTQRSFLTDLIQNGPRNQQALTAQAVNQAMSGPGMVGAGEGAQARAAGNAAAQVGTNALNQQLSAAQSLGGATPITTLANAGNNFIGQMTGGQQQTNTIGQNASNTVGSSSSNTAGNTSSNTTGSSNTIGLTNLLNNTNTNTNESQSGTSNAGSAQIGIGQAPSQTTQTSGGCYICTAYVDLGWMKADDVRRAAYWKLARPQYHRSLAGYSIYGPALAWLVLHSRIFATLWFPWARGTLLAELDLTKGRKSDWFPATCHFIFHYGSLALAVLTGRRQAKQCNTATSKLLNKHNLSFPCLFG